MIKIFNLYLIYLLRIKKKHNKNIFLHITLFLHDKIKSYKVLDTTKMSLYVRFVRNQHLMQPMNHHIVRFRFMHAFVTIGQLKHQYDAIKTDNTH